MGVLVSWNGHNRTLAMGHSSNRWEMHVAWSEQGLNPRPHDATDVPCTQSTILQTDPSGLLEQATPHKSYVVLEQVMARGPFINMG